MGWLSVLEFLPAVYNALIDYLHEIRVRGDELLLHGVSWDFIEWGFVLIVGG